MKLNLKRRFDLGDDKNNIKMKILDDDHCPNCETKGYHTENNRDALIDCPSCLQLMCKFCLGDDGFCKACSK